MNFYVHSHVYVTSTFTFTSTFIISYLFVICQTGKQNIVDGKVLLVAYLVTIVSVVCGVWIQACACLPFFGLQHRIHSCALGMIW